MKEEHLLLSFLFVLKMSEIKILQPITNYIKEFDSPDEFNLFYNKHKEEIDSTTTHKTQQALSHQRLQNYQNQRCFNVEEARGEEARRGTRNECTR